MFRARTAGGGRDDTYLWPRLVQKFAEGQTSYEYELIKLESTRDDKIYIYIYIYIYIPGIYILYRTK